MKEADFPVVPSYSVQSCFSANGCGLLLRMPDIPPLVLPLDKNAIAQIRNSLNEVEAFLNKSGNA